MTNKEQLYSQDKINYGSYDDLMRELPDLYNIGERVEVWEADKVEWKHSDFVDVDDLICRMQDNAMDCCGDGAEEYLNKLNEMQKLDLHICIAEWFNKNAKLDFYGVENDKKIMVTVE